MHKEQIIRKDELTSFEATLQDHQKAVSTLLSLFLSQFTLNENYEMIS
jgi:hypothetical protein